MCCTHVALSQLLPWSSLKSLLPERWPVFRFWNTSHVGHYGLTYATFSCIITSCLVQRCTTWHGILISVSLGAPGMDMNCCWLLCLVPKRESLGVALYMEPLGMALEAPYICVLSSPPPPPPPPSSPPSTE